MGTKTTTPTTRNPSAATTPAAATSTPLEGQVALITGGARRLGSAIARRLHAGGATIAVHYRSSASDADALVTELNAARTGSAAAFCCDLLDVPAISTLVAAVTQRFGR
ncbi:MAG TPA: SDR family NAD(P)-dependent oxidoreductase, partial [Steroidobacteraceae bacterium]|nr:SDR family NAD(P)-dependent oxidoreductase [Steroidobacteraceae bacterium]